MFLATAEAVGLQGKGSAAAPVPTSGTTEMINPV